MNTRTVTKASTSVELCACMETYYSTEIRLASNTSRLAVGLHGARAFAMLGVHSHDKIRKQGSTQDSCSFDLTPLNQQLACLMHCWTLDSSTRSQPIALRHEKRDDVSCNDLHAVVLRSNSLKFARSSFGCLSLLLQVILASLVPTVEYAKATITCHTPNQTFGAMPVKAGRAVASGSARTR